MALREKIIAANQYGQTGKKPPRSRKKLRKPKRLDPAVAAGLKKLDKELANEDNAQPCMALGVVLSCSSTPVLAEIARVLVDELSRSDSATTHAASTTSLIEMGPAVLHVVVTGLFRITSAPQFVALCVVTGKIGPMLTQTERTNLLLHLINLVGRTPDTKTAQALAATRHSFEAVPAEGVERA